jgi:hypothetical protein
MVSEFWKYSCMKPHTVRGTEMVKWQPHDPSVAHRDFGGEGHAAPAAHGGHPQPLPGPPQLMQKADNDTRPSAAHRVPKADTATVHVGDLAVQVQGALAGDVLRGEGLIHLNAVVVVDLVACPRQQVLDCWDGTLPHQLRGASPTTHAADHGQGPQPQLLALVIRHQQQSGGAVVDAGGVAGRDGPDVGDERWGQLLQLRQGQARTKMLVLVHNHGAFLRFDLHRHDLLLEQPSEGCSLHVIVAAESNLIHFLAGNFVLLGEELGGEPHDVWLSAHHGDGPVLWVRHHRRAHHQPVDHCVHQLRVGVADAPASPGDHVGGVAHGLHTATQDHVGKSGSDVEEAGLEGLHATEAHSVNGHPRHGVLP